jgi:hypothetical protein
LSVGKASPSGVPAHGAKRRKVPRVVWVLLGVAVLIGVLVTFAYINPWDLETPKAAPTANAKPSASSSSTRPPYLLPQVSESGLPGAQQCPDAGSIGAGESDTKTEVVEIKGNSSAAIRLLGPNRRVVIAQGAVMTGPVTLCGDGATVLVIGAMKGTVLLQGSGVKIVLQDAANPPPAYSTSNGRVLRCTTNATDPNTPHCADFTPRPGAKPNG